MANIQDPRKSGNPKTVNEELLDRIVRHLLYLTRLQTTEANWIKEQLDKGLFPDIKDRVAVAISRIKEVGGESNIITAAQQQQLSGLVSQLTGIVSPFMDGLRDKVTERLNELAQMELDFEVRLFKKTIPVEVNFETPSIDQVQNIIQTQPIPLNRSGKAQTLRELFSDLSDNVVSGVNGQIRQGLLQGESIDAITRRIRGTRAQGFTDGVLNTTRNQAESLARTGVIHSSNQATNALYRQNDDLIKSIQWVVTLDSRTCYTCMDLADESPYPLDNHPSPPAHIRCRCTTVPVLKSFRELGLDVDDVPESTRASLNGQVPESLTYNGWLRTQPAEIQKEALGASRYRAWKAGDAQISDFVNDSGKTLTLDQIRRAEGDIFDEPIGLN